MLQRGSLLNGKLFAIVFVFFLFWSFSVLAICTHVNCRYDISPERTETVKVINKYTPQGKTLNYLAVVEPWRESSDSITLNVPADIYGKLEPEKSSLQVSLKDGWLGFEWIAGLSRGEYGQPLE